MANSINIATEGLSGTVGAFVYRSYYGKTVVANKPSPYSSNTPAQLAHRELFKQASSYARKAIADPVLLEFYQSKLRGAQRAYNLALADFIHAPVIHGINYGNYNGRKGDTIGLQVTDNGRVASVQIIIQSNGAQIERGDAVNHNDGLHWTYTTHVNAKEGDALQLRVVATDLAGRSTFLEISNLSWP